MIKTSNDNNLWLVDFDKKTNELSFRTTRNHQHLQKENVKKEKIDVIETEYFEHKTPVATVFTVIAEYLKGLVENKGTVNVVRV